jgi:hypothetical protein
MKNLSDCRMVIDGKPRKQTKTDAGEDVGRM